ncbi:MAG TPA: hypothetical protein DD473_04205 [Planctomycetaceae bacterium]|nr:hypothetical protein [Planctomycetaceae bacterium]
MALSMELANLIWILIAAALVMLMQGGFCFLETGLVRAKNSINVAMKNLADFCIAGVLFWMVGFGMMFGQDYSGLIGTSYFFVDETNSTWLLAFFLFQLVFCGTATTIISGAVAERMRFSGYLLLSAVVSALVYPVFGHWAWGGLVEGTGTGWLCEMGFIDFAGSTVVHSVGGWTALMTVLVVGPRLGRFTSKQKKIHGHNYPMAALGTLLLWFGWFGFNGGSTLAIDGSIPLILVNTNLSAAAGGVAGLLLSRLVHGRVEVGDIMNGVIAGLVGITAACHMVTPMYAIIIGVISSTICLFGVILLEKLKIDDVIGAVPAHAFAGAWGTLAVAIFGNSDNFSNGMSRLEQLQIQALGVGTCFVWASGVTLLSLGILRLFFSLRVSEEAEIQGLNIHEHGASTEIIDLLDDMKVQSIKGDFSTPVSVEPHTEVGQIAAEYNKVLHKVVEEIENREKLLKQLKVAEENYRSIFENAIEGIYRSTFSGKLLEANPALANMLGYSSVIELMEDTQDICSQYYVDPDSRKVLLERLKQDGSVKEYQIALRRRDGTALDVVVNARLFPETEQSSAFIEGSVTDISERIQTEELRKQKESAEAASHAKSAFLATMSHEIRTPLNGVIGMLELLNDTEMNSKQSHYANIAKSSADSLLSLINDILDFSKIEAGKLELDPAEFDLESMVEDVADMFNIRAEQKGIELTCHVWPNVANRVIGDSERLRQVLVNLIGNALKFTESGQVSVEVQADDVADNRQMISLSVQDTGIGMPEEIQERLFLPFEQADGSTTRKFGGTGLGLAICRQLIELMGGTITIESALGEGSKFICRIPFDLSKGTRLGHKIDARIQGMRILAVDDNETNRTILQSLLQSWGAEVETAESAAKAAECLKKAQSDNRPFQIGVLDYRMPETDGIGLARMIKSDPQISEIELMMLTSSDCEISREELKTIGIKSCFSKPIRSSRLFDALITTLYQHSSQELIEEDVAEEVVVPEINKKVEGRVLIVDDNEINQIVTQEIVEQYGWRCRVASNGQEAIDLLKRRAFDLVLMDCQMPVMDGFTATGEIRKMQAVGELPEYLPVIALTANAVKGDRDRCLAAGMDEYVSKPINPQNLLQKMLSLTQGKMNQDSNGQVQKDSAIELQVETHLADVESELDNDAIDWPTLIERCGGNDEIAFKVLKKFHDRLPDDIRELENAIENHDWESSGRIVHTLKGAAGNVSAVEVSEAALKLETIVRSQPEETACFEPLEELKSRVTSCLRTIEVQLEQVLKT